MRRLALFVLSAVCLHAGLAAQAALARQVGSPHRSARSGYARLMKSDLGLKKASAQ